MFTSEPKKLTDLARVFLEPANATHRQYEALRAYFVDGLSSGQAARRFGYTPGSFRVLVHQFRQNPRRNFFLTPAKGPRAAPKADPLRDRIIALRKQNLSIYDISRNLAHQGNSLSPVAVAHILKEEGFARLPRRAGPGRARPMTNVPSVLAPPSPMSPMSGNSTSAPRRSAPSSAACSSSCQCWPPSPWTGSSGTRVSLARR